MKTLSIVAAALAICLSGAAIGATTPTGDQSWIPAASSAAPADQKFAQSRSYIRGPRGGCYYINRNGNKTYVDRSLCNRR